jgi:hypothetical protein
MSFLQQQHFGFGRSVECVLACVVVDRVNGLRGWMMIGSGFFLLLLENPGGGGGFCPGSSRGRMDFVQEEGEGNNSSRG